MQLRPVEIEALVEGARETTTAQHDATVRDELATGSQRIVSPGTTPTVALTPVEIDAIVRGHAVGPVEAATGAKTRSATRSTSQGTVENIRLARGSASQAPAATPDGHARGPRRGRETLRADRIRTQRRDDEAEPASAAPAPAAGASASPASAAAAPAMSAAAAPATSAAAAPTLEAPCEPQLPASRPARRTQPWRKR